MHGFRDVCSSSGSVMAGEQADQDDNTGLSSEDSSCPEELGSGTELDLALGLSVGLKSRRNHSKSKVRSSSSLSSSSSSLTRESTAGGTKRSADSNVTGQVAVGWPPVRTYRINSLVNNQTKSSTTVGLGLNVDIQKDIATKNGVAAENDDASFIKSTRTSMLVKVTMDGVVIGRKIDLNAQDSYETLTETLEEMFFQKPSSATRSDTQGCKTTRASELLNGSSEYILTYQDKDGDWMLVGDVPWEMFLGSVKRLRIMKKSDEIRVGTDDGTER